METVDENMSGEKKLTRQEVLDEVAKFQENMEELRLIKNVASDLRNYRRMIRIKHYD